MVRAHRSHGAALLSGLRQAERLERVLAAIDRANADDPNRITLRGVARPKELAHAELVSQWVERLAPAASEALRIAARAHHLRRWSIPRADYPAGRPGYLRWRKALQQLHAETCGEILAAQGYPRGTIERVGELLRKRGLGSDPEVQSLEDAMCLVFLETQLAELAGRFDAEKVVGILRKTLRKMSAAALDAAADVPLAEAERALLARALAPE